jgi:hypothetical protein
MLACRYAILRLFDVSQGKCILLALHVIVCHFIFFVLCVLALGVKIFFKFIFLTVVLMSYFYFI